jgi:lysylphosphatidylglycerol synthetase-like protein (DUF2156 family)
MEERRQLLRQYGNFCGAYSTLREGMSYFDDEHCEGYIAYTPMHRRAYAFGDPVIDESKKASILEKFHEFCHDKKMKPIFIQSDYSTVKLLHETGYRANEFATEIQIDLSGFDLKGKSKTHLRRWKNTAINAGVTVAEVLIKDLDPDELLGLSQEWIKKKGKKEKLFLLLPSMHFEDKEDMRVFCGFMDGRLIAVVTFEPIYAKGAVIGYSQVHMRQRMDAPNGTIDYVTLTAMEKFKQEGRSNFSLGVCTHIADSYREIDTNGMHSKFLKLVFWISWNTWLGNMMYPVDGNKFHKEKYRGTKRKVYLALPRMTPFDVLSFLRANAIV